MIRGNGTSEGEYGKILWSIGDLFVVLVMRGKIYYVCVDVEFMGGVVLYWVYDEFLMSYLGVNSSSEKKFESTLYRCEEMFVCVEEIKYVSDCSNNWCGVLFGNIVCL